MFLTNYRSRLLLPAFTLLFFSCVFFVWAQELPNAPAEPLEVEELPELTEAVPTVAFEEAIEIPALDPEYYRDFQVVYEKPLSGRLAFSSRVGELERVFVLDMDARRVRKLVEGPGNSTYPTWSPDGRYLSFTSDGDGNKEIYITSWDGVELRRLTHNAVTDDNASWSPDGKEIVYYSETSPGTAISEPVANIFTVSASGRAQPKQITRFKGRSTTPRWSPNGKEIAYSTSRFWPGWDVCVWNLQGAKESCVLTGVDTFCRANWSANGDALVYSTGVGDEIDLGVFDFASRTKRKLTNLDFSEYDAIWFEAKKSILFVSDKESKKTFNIYKLDTNASAVSPILKSSHSVRYISYSKVKTFELEAQRIRNDEGAAKPAELAVEMPVLEKTLSPE